jgi:YD repeat-containing protein
VKPIKITNADGESIEIKYDSEGTIKIRHSDIDAKRWGELHEYAKRLRQPKAKSFVEAKGIDLNNPEAQELAQKLGGYVDVGGKVFIIGPEELAMIYAAIKKAGGIVPNWSSCP